jgi:hypothetical protein
MQLKMSFYNSIPVIPGGPGGPTPQSVKFATIFAVSNTNGVNSTVGKYSIIETLKIFNVIAENTYMGKSTIIDNTKIIKHPIKNIATHVAYFMLKIIASRMVVCLSSGISSKYLRNGTNFVSKSCRITPRVPVNVSRFCLYMFTQLYAYSANILAIIK